MGSKKKKSEKKKDFVKPKLRVGKTTPKASNHTDTSFVAKTISLPNQSLNVKLKAVTKALKEAGLPAEKKDVDLTHQLSLTKHHSSTTRKEVLLYIEQHLPSNPSSYNDLLNAITPLVIDMSQQVRTTLIQLFRSIAKKQQGLIELHTRSIILFIHSAMSHIQPPIRNDSTKFLEILIDYGFQPLVKGFFVKTLKAFCQILNFQLNLESKQSLSLAVTTSSAAGGSSKAARTGHLEILRKFLDKAVFNSEDENKANEENEVYLTIHPMTSMYMMKSTPQPYAHLKLFVQELKKTLPNGGADDIMAVSCEDVGTRRKILVDHFSKPLTKGLNDLIKEGGSVGKEANTVLQVLNKAVEDEKSSMETS